MSAGKTIAIPPTPNIAKEISVVSPESESPLRSGVSHRQHCGQGEQAGGDRPAAKVAGEDGAERPEERDERKSAHPRHAALAPLSLLRPEAEGERDQQIRSDVEVHVQRGRLHGAPDC
ncbi:MAG: hypothetical protein R2748_04390 [Bryobacterales bacterium]